jgi:hypothetical protein
MTVIVFVAMLLNFLMYIRIDNQAHKGKTAVMMVIDMIHRKKVTPSPDLISSIIWCLLFLVFNLFLNVFLTIPLGVFIALSIESVAKKVTDNIKTLIAIYNESIGG